MQRKRNRRLTATLQDRLWQKVVKTEGCWLWTGYSREDSGHGQIQRGRRGEGLVPVHVVAWELVNGPVPDGHILHHVCLNPSCVNPEHLEPVTRAEHVRIHQALRTTCRYGHPLDGRRPEGRFCRTCKRAGDRVYSQRRKAANGT